MSQRFPKVTCEECKFAYEAFEGSFKFGTCRCAKWKGVILKPRQEYEEWKRRHSEYEK